VIDLADFQFELLHSEHSDYGHGFGIFLDVSLDDGGFDPGTASWTTQDIDDDSGTTQMGMDVLPGPTWSWDLHVNRQTVAEALATLRDFTRFWRARQTAETRQQVSVIRYCFEGQTLRTYGRPRNFAAPPDNKILTGYVPINCTFRTVTPKVFEDVESVAEIPFVQSSSGGLRFPVRFPVSAEPDGQREGGIFVGGNTATYPVIDIVGPILNPWVNWSGVKRQFVANVPEGGTLTLDTRPWKKTITLNGVSYPGALGRRQYISDMTLEPGGHDVAFGGQSSSGLAKCLFKWRGAYEGY
jgi:hypothetical protein